MFIAEQVFDIFPHSQDVFSFGILLWELLTAKIPYSDMTPLQVCALGGAARCRR